MSEKQKMCELQELKCKNFRKAEQLKFRVEAHSNLLPIGNHYKIKPFIKNTEFKKQSVQNIKKLNTSLIKEVSG